MHPFCISPGENNTAVMNPLAPAIPHTITTSCAVHVQKSTDYTTQAQRTTVQRLRSPAYCLNTAVLNHTHSSTIDLKNILHTLTHHDVLPTVTLCFLACQAFNIWISIRISVYDPGCLLD